MYNLSLRPLAVPALALLRLAVDGVAKVFYLLLGIFLNKNVQRVYLLFVVKFFKGVQFVIERLPVDHYSRVRVLLQGSFKGPFTVDKSHVS